eukprot:TRINITY_DN1673_c0_g1_i3.p1 TRINITY_DN1673_c0_g1~~TRINITY_DN1673_c0_g1_i3.p1  ORF type:complete len:643 (+),score=152.86 TRINITY_DN1673_c0_g1_i3:88-2016(+)
MTVVNGGGLLMYAAARKHSQQFKRNNSCNVAKWEHDRLEAERLKRLADVKPSVESRRPPRPLGTSRPPSAGQGSKHRLQAVAPACGGGLQPVQRPPSRAQSVTSCSRPSSAQQRASSPLQQQLQQRSSSYSPSQRAAMMLSPRRRFEDAQLALNISPDDIDMAALQEELKDWYFSESVHLGGSPSIGGLPVPFADLFPAGHAPSAASRPSRRSPSKGSQRRPPGCIRPGIAEAMSVYSSPAQLPAASKAAFARGTSADQVNNAKDAAAPGMRRRGSWGQVGSAGGGNADGSGIRHRACGSPARAAMALAAEAAAAPATPAAQGAASSPGTESRRPRIKDVGGGSTGAGGPGFKDAKAIQDWLAEANARLAGVCGPSVSSEPSPEAMTPVMPSRPEGVGAADKDRSSWAPCQEEEDDFDLLPPPPRPESRLAMADDDRWDLPPGRPESRFDTHEHLDRTNRHQRPESRLSYRDDDAASAAVGRSSEATAAADGGDMGASFKSSSKLHAAGSDAALGSSLALSQTMRTGGSRASLGLREDQDDTDALLPSELVSMDEGYRETAGQNDDHHEWAKAREGDGEDAAAAETPGQQNYFSPKSHSRSRSSSRSRSRSRSSQRSGSALSQPAKRCLPDLPACAKFSPDD